MKNKACQHCALQSAFTRAPSVLLVIGAICSAVSKKNDLYVFFDSHSHGKNGISSSDGSSILMYVSCLEDLFHTCMLCMIVWQLI